MHRDYRLTHVQVISDDFGQCLDVVTSSPKPKAAWFSNACLTASSPGCAQTTRSTARATCSLIGPPRARPVSPRSRHGSPLRPPLAHGRRSRKYIDLLICSAKWACYSAGVPRNENKPKVNSLCLLRTNDCARGCCYWSVRSCHVCIRWDDTY
jgi:hypothetical protein